LTLRPSGARRTRSLLGRLRQLREPSGDPSSPVGHSPPIAVQGRDYEGLYDFLDNASPDSQPSVHAVPHDAPALDPEPSPVDRQMARALEVFNRSEHPRRVAGVTRSLGSPSVQVASMLDSEHLVTLVVAWDLCWYRYQVDLEDEHAGAQLSAQGMELEELPAQERVANAAADERGELSLK